MPANNFRVKVVQTCMLAHEEACWKLGQHPLGRRNWLVLSPGAAMQCWILLMKKPLQLLTNSLTASSLFTTPQKKIEAFHPTSAGFFAWRGNDKLPWLFLSEFLEHLSEEFVNCTNFAIFCEQCPWSPSIQKLLLTSTGIQHCSTMLNPTNQAAKQSSNRCVDVGFRFFLCLSHSKISILSHSKSIYIQYIYIYIYLDQFLTRFGLVSVAPRKLLPELPPMDIGYICWCAWPGSCLLLHCKRLWELWSILADQHWTPIV